MDEGQKVKSQINDDELDAMIAGLKKGAGKAPAMPAGMPPLPPMPNGAPGAPLPPVPQTPPQPNAFTKPTEPNLPKIQPDSTGVVPNESAQLPPLPPVGPAPAPATMPTPLPNMPSPVPNVDTHAKTIDPLAPAPAPLFIPDPVEGGATNKDTGESKSTSSDLDAIKRDAISELRPLVGKLQQQPVDRFDTLLMLIRSTDDSSLISEAHRTALDIKDDARRAQALLDIIKEIDYFSHK